MSRFRPARWLPGGHLQTLFSPLLRRPPQLQRQRERLTLADGDFIDLDWFGPDNPEHPCVILLHGLTGRKILLSVGRLTTRKGLREFVEHALPTIVQAQPDTMLVVIGEAPKNSLGAGIQTVESIQAQAAKSGVAEHIKFLGVITDKTLLATAYDAADVHVFPVRHIPDDPEGFGMVAIEAAAHGLPTVAFATGGVVDAVRHGESGYLADKGNYSGMSEYTLKVLRHSLNRENITSFVQGFAWEQFGKSISHALADQQFVKR